MRRRSLKQSRRTIRKREVDTIRIARPGLRSAGVPPGLPRRAISRTNAGQRPALQLAALLAFLALALFFAPQPARAQSVDQVAAQAKLGYVTDLAGVLSQSGKEQLTALCTEVQQKTQAQIAVVIIKTLDGREKADYGTDLAARLGIGPKSEDRGVLILFAVDDHQYYTAVGYGLEPILPDGKVGGFGREAVPYLRQGNYDAAILLLTRRIADTIAADRGVTLSGSAPAAPRENRGNSPGIPVVFIFLIIFFIFGAIRRALSPAGSRYRRGGGWWIGPMIGGMMGGGFGGGGGGGGGGGFGGFGGGGFGGGGAGGSW